MNHVQSATYFLNLAVQFDSGQASIEGNMLSLLEYLT